MGKYFYCSDKKLAECRDCHEIKPFREMQPMENRPNVLVRHWCLDCKRVHSVGYMKNRTQNLLESRYNKGDETVRFCECGDYFVNRYKNRTQCWTCRKEIKLNNRG